MTAQPKEPYPLTFDEAYPERGLGRMSTLLRLPLVARLLLISLPIGRPSTLQLALMLVLRKEYPRWWFDFNLERSRFSARVGVYSALMTDQKPSTEEAQSVSLEFEHPDASQLNRALPVVKWLMAWPHQVVPFALWLVGFAATVAARFAIVSIGRYPRALRLHRRSPALVLACEGLH